MLVVLHVALSSKVPLPFIAEMPRYDTTSRTADDQPLWRALPYTTCHVRICHDCCAQAMIRRQGQRYTVRKKWNRTRLMPVRLVRAVQHTECGSSKSSQMCVGELRATYAVKGHRTIASDLESLRRSITSRGPPSLRQSPSHAQWHEASPAQRPTTKTMKVRHGRL